jgi:hypothetical protein
LLTPAPESPRNETHRANGSELFDNPYFLTLVMFAGVLLAHFLGIQSLRLRARRLATKLGGKYISEGLLRLGRIQGDRGPMKYMLLSNSSISCLAMPVANEGMAICVGTRFYSDFPNWSHVHSVGHRVRRGALARYRRRDMSMPMDEALRPKVLRLLRNFEARFADEKDHQIVTGSLWIHEGRMEFQCLGVLKDIHKIDRILQYMHDVATRLEYLPVGGE